MGVFGPTRARPVIVGHRGVRRPDLAENTPEAFAVAVDEGATWVELDVRRAADGVVVLSHEPCTPDGIALVERSAAELEVAGVSTFADALAQLPAGVGINVEVKNIPGQPDYDPEDAIAAMVAEVLSPVSGQRPLLASSFNPLTVSRLRAELPDVPCGLVHLRTLGIVQAAAVALEQGAVALSSQVGAEGLDAEGVAAVHAQGMSVLVWTVNDTNVAAQLAAAGVDALCTDDPAAILGAVPPAS